MKKTAICIMAALGACFFTSDNGKAEPTLFKQEELKNVLSNLHTPSGEKTNLQINEYNQQ